MRDDDFKKKIDVSRETLNQLRRYEELLNEWNAAINLVSRASLRDLWSRHFLDSAQLCRIAPAAGTWADFGSGGGFPGLVAAIVCGEKAPKTKFVLIESDARKCAFLATVVRELELNVEVQAERIELLQPMQADVVSARALAPLSQLLELCQRHLSADGTALFLKGQRHKEEVEDARKLWRFRLEIHESLTDPRGVVLRVGEISRV